MSGRCLFAICRRRYLSFTGRKPGKKMNDVGYAMGAVGVYVLTSLFFLKFPFLYKKKRLDFKCAHISHRGGAAERLENTRHAYRNAVQCGTEMLELDVHMTADKIVVVSHDNHLVRITGEDVYIKDTRYEDLPLIQKALPVTFHHKMTCQHDGEQLRIEKLEDVFREFPGIPIHLDIKTYDEELMEETNILIKRYNREGITPWGNFSNKITSKLYEINPNIPLIFSAKRVLFTLVAFYIGLLPFLPLKESSFAIIMPQATERTRHPHCHKVSLMRRLAVNTIDFLLMSKVLFKHLTDRGINVYVWVLNEEEDFKRAFELGATGVMTDCPTMLQRWLDTNGINQSSS